jgi:hypothetical protein
MLSPIIIIAMNKYDIVDVIDEGAYGVVLKGMNRETKRLGDE